MVDKFIIQVDGDISPLEQKLNRIESRIKSMREFGPGGTYTRLAEQYRGAGDSERANRIEEYRQRSSQTNRRQLARDLKEQENLMTKNEKTQERISKAMNSTLKSQQNINKAKELQIQLEEKHLKLAENISKIKNQMSDRGPGMGPFSGYDIDFMRRATSVGGVRGAMRGVGALGRVAMRNPAVMAAGLGAIGSAVETGGSFYKQIATYPERIAQREATTAGMLSETARLQQQRRSYEMALFGPERIKAMERARTRVQAEQTTDITGTIGSTLKGAAAGLGGAAMIGAELGLGAGILAAPFTGGTSLIAGPIAGAKMGAAAYGVPAALGGAALGFGSSMMDDRKRSMIFNREAYQKEMDSVFAGTYQQQVAAERAKSFEKDLAAKYFERNADRFRGLQRSFGLSDKDLFQGDESLFQRAARAGFNTDTMSDALQRLQAAGGPTSLARTGGAEMAARFQRNLDLTNAPELLGRISGVSGGSGTESKDAIIRMYAEATRIGLDTSEIRDYLQTTADMAYKSGGDVSDISSLVGMGVGGLTTRRGIEASRNALENLRRQTSEVGGLTGQYQLAEFQNEEISGLLGEQGLSLQEMAYLAGTDVTKLTDEQMRGYFLERGIKSEDITPKMTSDLKKAFQRAKGRAATRSPEQLEALEQFKEAEEEFSKIMGPASREERDRLELARKKASEAFGLADTGFAKLDKPEQLALLRQFAGLTTDGDIAGGDLKKREEEARKKLEEDTGRLADRRERSQAVDDLANMKRLSEQSGNLATAFDNTTVKAVQLGQAMAGLAEIMNKVKGSDSEEKVRESVQKVFNDFFSEIGESEEGANMSKETAVPSYGPSSGR